MTTSLGNLVPVAVLDPQMVQFGNETAVLSGASDVNYINYSTSSVTNSKISFNNVNPPKNVLTSRYFSVTVPTRITLSATGVTGGKFLLNPSQTSIRSSPLMKACTSLKCVINGSTFSSEPYHYWPAMEHFNMPDEMTNTSGSQSASYRSNSQHVDDLFAGIASPCASYLDGITGANPQFYPMTIVNQTNVADVATSIVDVVFTEALALSPLYHGPLKDDHAGFVGIESLQIELTFDSSPANRMMLIDNVSAGVAYAPTGWSSSVQFTNFTAPAFTYKQSAPLCLFKHMQPNISNRMTLDQSYNYPYSKVNVFQTEQTALASQAESQAVANSVDVSDIPSKIYVFLRKRDVDISADPTSTDSFAAIQSLSITFNNRNLLINATPQQLYQMSVRNGLNQSWASWSGQGLNKPVMAQTGGAGYGSPGEQFAGNGSIVCLDVVSDLGLPADMSVSSLARTSMQIRCNYKNVSRDTISYTLYVVFIQEGNVVLSQDHAIQQVGLLSADAVLDAKASGETNPLTWADSNAMRGGSFREGLLKFLKTAKPVAEALAPLLIKMVAAGDDVKSKRGGVRASGGRSVGRASLRDRL